MITKVLRVRGGFRACGWIAVCAMAASAVCAQSPAPRIRSEISNGQTTQLKATQQAVAPAQFDAGRMPANARLNGMSIVFNRTAAQQADLEALLAAQQNPSSAQFHHWLSPEQFAARFGMSQTDIDKVQAWLQQQGFSVDSVARSRNMIRFSGTVGQVDLAFQTQMHYFNTNGEKHFAPSRVLSVPAAIAPTIEAVRNLSDFRPRPMHVSPRRAFTSSQSGNVFFAPGDIAMTYNINSLYSESPKIDGTGQSIAIVGQSAIDASDIEAFESAAGLPTKDPVMVIVPGSGNPMVFSGGDEGESDLDVEWSQAIAPGATINFVYTGDNTNFNAFDATVYAVVEKIAPIISISYGACETALNGFSLESVFQQAAAQGQTVLSASGDQGSTACSGDLNGLTTAQQNALAVNYPASSPNVTAVGGTEISTQDSTSTNSTYWTGQGSADSITSAKQYIPEIVWNDDSTQFGLGSTGGGSSALWTQPTYQSSYFSATGEKNPDSAHRLVPDISLYSSATYPGYLFCSGDSADWNTTQAPLQQGSCTKGFRDGATGDLTVAGGTSFATPIFAGMLALINQKKGYTGGQGLANTNLYKLAQDSTTYASAFHDVTSGNNNCTAGTQFCGATTTGFSAVAGYDQATGLGSVDLANLVAAWPVDTNALTGTTTKLTAANANPDLNSADNISIQVTSASGTVPTGTVNLTIDQSLNGTAATGGTTATANLDGTGNATYSATFTTWGSHTIVAQYPGDSSHEASTGAVSFSIIPFRLSASPISLTATQGNSATSTITINSMHSYAGTVNFSLATSSTSLSTNGCYTIGNTAVAANGSATATLTLFTSQSACKAAGAVKGGGALRNFTTRAKLDPPSPSTGSHGPTLPLAAGAIFGLLLFSRRLRTSKAFAALSCFLLLGILSFSVGCGSSSSSSNNNNNNNGGGTTALVAKGNYAVSLTGVDATTCGTTTTNCGAQATVNLGFTVN